MYCYKLCIIHVYINITKYKISKSHYNCKFSTTKTCTIMTNYGSFQLIIVTFRCVAHIHLKCIRLLCGSSVEVMSINLMITRWRYSQTCGWSMPCCCSSGEQEFLMSGCILCHDSLVDSALSQQLTLSYHSSWPYHSSWLSPRHSPYCKKT